MSTRLTVKPGDTFVTFETDEREEEAVSYTHLDVYKRQLQQVPGAFLHEDVFGVVVAHGITFQFCDFSLV